MICRLLPLQWFSVYNRSAFKQNQVGISVSDLNQDVKPYISASESLPELTIKVIFLSIILACILAGANCYLALKVGTTISASIPASVISIGILRFFKQSNILESTMVQTAASAGEGVAAAVSFVLPAMILLHYWKHFPYWETLMITMLGGVLGVLFSVPLRRVLLNIPALKFPEGTAIGKVLTACAEGGGDLGALCWGALVGGLVSFCQAGLQIFTDSLQVWFRVGQTFMGFGIGYNPALVAAGYIIGIEVGLSLLTGVVIGWVMVLPALFLHFGLSSSDMTRDAYTVVMDMWSSHLRFVGVGVMFVGGIWTLLRLIKPLLDGWQTPVKKKSSPSGVTRLRTDRDIPGFWIILGVIIIAIAIYYFMWTQMKYLDLGISVLGTHGFILLVIGLILAIGFSLSTVCGYFTGMVGSTNNPLSGVLIIAVALIGALFLLFKLLPPHLHHILHLLGVLIVITAVIATAASISNENIQDLKAGQIMGATPWKQQIVLILGVVCSSFTIAPVLDLLFQAYGMAGVYPRAGMDPTQMLPAPQASLIASVAQGILTGHLEWTMISLGVAIAVVLIVVDEWLKPRGYRLPVLAVGLGIYLPTDVITPVIVGAIVSYLVNRSMRQRHDVMSLHEYQHQNGLLLACGLVAGAALMGVILAVPFVLMGSSNALSIMPHSLHQVATILGFLSLLAICRWLYHRSF